ncbi:MAG: GPP34 family phosphoprotein [Clostridia bacterium]|nr:GPP34 family phosphoprotein [Clostridia bacterium]
MTDLMEKLILLAYIEDKGRLTYYASGTIKYGIYAALLMELAKAGKIKLQDKKIILMDKTTVGNELMDEALNVIAQYNKPVRIQSVVFKLSYKLKKITNRIYEAMEAKGIFRQEERRFLLLFPYKQYVMINNSLKRKEEARYREVLLNENTKIEMEDIMTVCLVEALGFRKILFSGDERKAARERAKVIFKGQLRGDFDTDLYMFVIKVAKAVKDSIASSHAAAAGAGAGV